MINLGLLITRLVIGVLFIGHGAQKLFGSFGGYGLKGTGGWFKIYWDETRYYNGSNRRIG